MRVIELLNQIEEMRIVIKNLQNEKSREYLNEINIQWRNEIDNILSHGHYIEIIHGINVDHVNNGDADSWCENNCKDKWDRKYLYYFFESEDDAMRFKLVFG
jgi:hypothetical protein